MKSYLHFLFSYLHMVAAACRVSFVFRAQHCSDTIQDLDLVPSCPDQGQSAGLTSLSMDRLRNKETSSRLWGFRSFTAKRWSPWKNKHPRCGGPSHWATLQWGYSIQCKSETVLAGSVGHRWRYRWGSSLILPLLLLASLAILRYIWSSRTLFFCLEYSFLYHYSWSLSLPPNSNSNDTAFPKPSYITLPLP